MEKLDKRMDGMNRAVLAVIAILVVVGIGCAINTVFSKNMAPTALTIIPSGTPRVVQAHVTEFGIHVPTITSVLNTQSNCFYSFEGTISFEPGWWYEIQAHLIFLDGPAPSPSFWKIVRITRHEMPFRDLSIRPL